ncbi:MAG TPA: DUF3313 family protein [Myxococcota bacterium]|nr:DUF3313 family protein [Myxococcota bacterium]
MLHRSFAAALAAALVGCAAHPDPTLEMGPDAKVAPDGLHRVSHVPFGTLYMRPDYAFGSYPRFTMGRTQVHFKPDSRVLSDAEIADIKERFDAVARQLIAETGRVEVDKPGPCVARVNLALVDVDLLDPKALSTHGTTTVLESFGSLTLVLEISDGYTAEPLMRYTRARRLRGGPATGADPAQLTAVTTTLEEFARGIQRDFQLALPRVAGGAPISCEERAGLPPPVSAR